MSGARITLFVDLGDLFTKVIAVGSQGQQRLRFPSVVARRLQSGEAAESNLLLDSSEPMLRPDDYDSIEYPRTLSYPGAEAFDGVTEVEPGERFAGVLAARYGADRELLGIHPTEENIDVLVHKALLQSAAGYEAADLVFVLDVGATGETLLEYVAAGKRKISIDDWGLERHEPTEMRVATTVLDAAECAAAALPPEVSLERVGRVLLMDIGYLRTTLSVISNLGCEYQEQLNTLGISDCVRRVLRDGQDHDLIADEYAVINALEQSQSIIEVAGREFDISQALQSAVRGLEEELTRATQRAIVQLYDRRAETCKAVAIIGGGAAIVGQGVAARLEALDLGLDVTWITTDTRYFLLEGAERIRSRSTGGE